MSLYASDRANEYGEFIVNKMTESIKNMPSSRDSYEARNLLFKIQNKYPYENLGDGMVRKDNSTMAADFIDNFYPGVLDIKPKEFKRLNSFEKVDLLQQFVDGLGLESDFVQFTQGMKQRPLKSIKESPTDYSPVYEFSDDEIDSLSDSIGYGDDPYETDAQTMAHLRDFDPKWRRAVAEDPDLALLFGRVRWPSFSWNRRSKYKRPQSFDSTSTGFSDDDYQEYIKATVMGHDDYKQQQKLRKQKMMETVMGLDDWAHRPCTINDEFIPNRDMDDYVKKYDPQGKCYRKLGRTTRNQLYTAFLAQAEKSLRNQGYNPNNPRHEKKLDSIFLDYEDKVGSPDRFNKADAMKYFKGRFNTLYFQYGSRAQRAKRRSRKR